MLAIIRQNLLSSSSLPKNIKLTIYRTIFLHVSLYGRESLLLTLKQERRLRVFENRVLRRIFGPKREKVTGEWIKLNNEKLNYLYYLPNINWVIKSRRMKYVCHVASVGDRRGAYRVLVGKP